MTVDPGGTPETGPTARLTADDLIPDRALAESDSDEFDYAAIAARVADLVAVADTPLTLGLFGSWGSGKSSVCELLRRNLRSRQDRTEVVRYDASRYRDESLQRNFISNAADKLGFKEYGENKKPIKDNQPFYRGLYESRRRADVDFAQLAPSSWNRSALLWGVVSFAGLLVLFCLLAGTSSLLTPRDFVGQIKHSLGEFLAPAVVVTIVGAGLAQLLSGASVDIEQSQPSADEEFSRVFEDLISRALAKREFERILFFIDELDRCSPEEIISVLAAVRAFQDREHCVFIVAADRSVLEAALLRLPQPTPVNVDSPYYSSAGSFFDKVFQFQVPLPPLRNRRLNRYARDLIRQRGGLWNEIRLADDSEELFDAVMFALIPGHVSSPRRVKILLNAFAVNARIAQSRGIDWFTRAQEIAKLTVLQVEFPGFAADLIYEPRLPSYVIDPPEIQSPRLKALLERHRNAEAVRPNSDLVPTDAPIATGLGEEVLAPDAVRQAIIESQQQQLIRYLQRTKAAGVSDPQSDLLYLEAAGAALGLEDRELGELIETEAAERPEVVIDALSRRSPTERAAAIRVLADIADGEEGTEAANVMRALVEATASLGPDAAPVKIVVLDSIRSYIASARLRDRVLVHALDIALRFEDGSEASLVGQLFEDEHLLDTSDRAGAVASMLDRIPQAYQEQVRNAFVRFLPDSTVLFAPVKRLPPAHLDSLLNVSDDGGVIFDRTVKELALEDAQQFALTVLADAAERDDADRGDGQAVLLIPLLRVQGTYRVASEQAEAVFASASPALSALAALTGIERGPTEDWAYWSDSISDGEWHTEDEPFGGRIVGAAVRAISTVLNALDANDDAAVDVASDVVTKLASLLPEDLPEPLAEDIAVSIQRAASARSWWEDDAQLAAQARLYRLASALQDASRTTEDLYDAALSRDATRVTAAQLQVRLPTGQIGSFAATTDTSVLDRIASLAPLFPTDAAVEVLNAISGLSVDDTGPQLVSARIELALKASAGWEVDASVVAPAELAAAVLHYGSEEIAVGWFDLDPSPDAVQDLIGIWHAEPGEELHVATGRWAKRVSEQERTATLAEIVVSPGIPVSWVGAVIAARPTLLGGKFVNELGLMTGLVDQARDASSVDGRKRVVDIVLELKPVGRNGQKLVADLIVSLAESGRRVDFEQAERAIFALRKNHQSADRLREAFARAESRHGFKLRDRYRNALRDAGIRYPKKSLLDRLTGSG